MILDSSAVVAVMREEAELESFTDLIEQAPMVAISAATVVEASLVLGSSRHRDLDEWLDALGADVIALDLEQARIAREAHATYGRGSGSPARLNLGDCFSFALAKTTGRPLLFKGGDFEHTDVVPAYSPSSD